jgi:hypothetical protein
VVPRVFGSSSPRVTGTRLIGFGGTATAYVEGGIQQLSGGDTVCAQVSGLTGGGVLSEVSAGLC